MRGVHQKGVRLVARLPRVEVLRAHRVHVALVPDPEAGSAVGPVRGQPEVGGGVVIMVVAVAERADEVEEAHDVGCVVGHQGGQRRHELGRRVRLGSVQAVQRRCRAGPQPLERHPTGARETAPVEVAVRQPHEHQTDVRQGIERAHGQGPACDGEIHVGPLVRDVRHVRVRRARTVLTTAPVRLVRSGVTSREVHRPHAPSGGDVPPDRGIHEQQVVVLVSQKVQGAGTGHDVTPCPAAHLRYVDITDPPPSDAYLGASMALPVPDRQTPEPSGAEGLVAGPTRGWWRRTPQAGAGFSCPAI